MQVTRVLIDGGAGLNVIFATTLRKMGLESLSLLTPTNIPFYAIIPGKAAIPLGQITLSVTFGTPANFRTEFIKFEVANFDSSYHTIIGRPTLAKFMVIPHYLYLLLKTSGLNGVLSFKGDLKHSYNCEIEAVHIAAKA